MCNGISPNPTLCEIILYVTGGLFDFFINYASSSNDLILGLSLFKSFIRALSSFTSQYCNVNYLSSPNSHNNTGQGRYRNPTCQVCLFKPLLQDSCNIPLSWLINSQGFTQIFSTRCVVVKRCFIQGVLIRYHVRYAVVFVVVAVTVALALVLPVDMVNRVVVDRLEYQYDQVGKKK